MGKHGWRCLTMLIAVAFGSATVKTGTAGFVHVEGAPPGYTGGFGEATCTECHIGSPEDDDPSSLQLEGLPESYAPGSEYRVTVRLRSFEMFAAGFQGAFRFADTDRRSGQTAGEVTPEDGRTQIVIDADTGVEYIQHTQAGSAAGGQEAEWAFRWRPPNTPGPVMFHIAANSGSGDNSPLDDLVYIRAISLAPKRPPEPLKR